MNTWHWEDVRLVSNVFVDEIWVIRNAVCELIDKFSGEYTAIEQVECVLEEAN